MAADYKFPEWLYPTFNDLFVHPEGEPKQDGNSYLQTYRDPANPDLSMNITSTHEPVVLPGGSGNKDGYIARTLHPTVYGHKAIGDIIVNRLKEVFKRTNNAGGSCPAG
jgi:hypothetical protein